MKLKNWNMNTTKVRAWAENQPETDQLQAVLLSLTLGDNAGTDELRSTYWTAIRSIGSSMDNFPKARRGRESTLTDGQEIVLATVEANVASAIASIGSEYHETLLQVIVPHGRTGGVFEDMTAMANYFVKQAHNYIIQSIKDNRISMSDDGEFDLDSNDMLQITPRPTKADSSEGDEEE
tara:strand:+ start:5602 stop:6138 length:537 start_codon:yes stop_codon:yes gene_type:complete